MFVHLPSLFLAKGETVMTSMDMKRTKIMYVASVTARFEP